MPKTQKTERREAMMKKKKKMREKMRLVPATVVVLLVLLVGGYQPSLQSVHAASAFPPVNYLCCDSSSNTFTLPTALQPDNDMTVEVGALLICL